MKNYVQNQDDDKIHYFIDDNDRRKLFAFIYSRIFDKEIANDLTQDTLLKAYVKVSENIYHDQGNFFGWLISIAKNIINDHYRREYRLQEQYKSSKNKIADGLGYCYESQINTAEESDFHVSAMRQAVRKAFLKLPENQRFVINMKIYKQLTFRKIAQKNQSGVNTTIARYYYGIRRLSDHFSSQEKEKYSDLLEEI